MLASGEAAEDKPALVESESRWLWPPRRLRLSSSWRRLASASALNLPGPDALASVLAYRVVNFWLVILTGWAIMLLLGDRPGAAAEVPGTQEFPDRLEQEFPERLDGAPDLS